jgi:hypothetical protein
MRKSMRVGHEEVDAKEYLYCTPFVLSRVKIVVKVPFELSQKEHM